MRLLRGPSLSPWRAIRFVRETEGVALAANSAHGHDTAGEAVQLEPGSYRDRNGVVFYRDGRVFRGISAKALANWERLSTAAFFREQIALGSIVATSRTPPELEAQLGGDWAAVLEHARIPFVSYPYEWTFGMLKDAALLHLDLLEAALGAGMILKDSSAYNIQWRGAQPVFIDIPSFEVLRQGEPWVGYRQFCELFLYPLMMQAYKGVDFRPWLRGSIDGIPAPALRPLLSTRDLARPGVLMHVVAQNALQRRYSSSSRNVRNSLAEAGFDERLIARNVASLKKIIGRMTATGAKTTWADYARTHSYDDAEFQAKLGFVREAAAHRHWRLVWDLGCNAGAFSRSPPSTPTMSWRWTATGWRSSSSTRASRLAPTGTKSCLWWSTSPIRHRARAGRVWNASRCPTAADPISRSASP